MAATEDLEFKALLEEKKHKELITILTKILSNLDTKTDISNIENLLKVISYINLFIGHFFTSLMTAYLSFLMLGDFSTPDDPRMMSASFLMFINTIILFVSKLFHH